MAPATRSRVCAGGADSEDSTEDSTIRAFRESLTHLTLGSTRLPACGQESKWAVLGLNR
jgi:hypothetical protein